MKDFIIYLNCWINEKRTYDSVTKFKDFVFKAPVWRDMRFRGSDLGLERISSQGKGFVLKNNLGVTGDMVSYSIHLWVF